MPLNGNGFLSPCKAKARGDFLPYKPGTLSPVATETFSARMYFCFYPHVADKFNSSLAQHGSVVDVNHSQIYIDPFSGQEENDEKT